MLLIHFSKRFFFCRRVLPAFFIKIRFDCTPFYHIAYMWFALETIINDWCTYPYSVNTIKHIFIFIELHYKHYLILFYGY